jgi:hypothetical protein
VVRRVKLIELRHLAAKVIPALDKVDPVSVARKIKGSRHAGHATTDNQDRSFSVFCCFHFLNAGP